MTGKQIKHIARLCLLIASTVSILLCGCSENEPVITNLGIPSEQSYKTNYYNARNPWDMIIQDGILYVGAGDYSSNSGSTDIWSYNIKSGEWAVSGTLDDESIAKFISTDGVVVAPGIDSVLPTWEYGNYHVLENGEWKSFFNIPNAVHNFDIINYNGKTFYALGTESNRKKYPIKVSEDNGKTFKDVPLYKGGIDDIYSGLYELSRVYDFFIAGGELYCLFTPYVNGWQEYEIYKYSKDKFEFIATASDLKLDFKNYQQNPINEKANMGDTCYFTSGYLYKTKDFTELAKIQLPNNEPVADILVEKGNIFKKECMYILGTYKNDFDYKTIIYKYTDDNEIEKVAEFSADCPALSFEKKGNTFFVGLGRNDCYIRSAGTILKIDL